MYRRLIAEEELNLQDLIFLLLSFFIVAQTLLIFKVQKDLIIPPKVDKEPELVIDEKNPEIITVIIDEKSTIAALAGTEKREVLHGFDAKKLDASYEEYCDPNKNKDLFLPTEDAKAYEKVIEVVKNLKKDFSYSKPIVGLIADHRARYGTIFQVNIAIQELIRNQEIDPTVKWKVFIDKKKGETIYDQFPGTTSSEGSTQAQPPAR